MSKIIENLIQPDDKIAFSDEILGLFDEVDYGFVDGDEELDNLLKKKYSCK